MQRHINCNINDDFNYLPAAFALLLSGNLSGTTKSAKCITEGSPSGTGPLLVFEFVDFFVILHPNSFARFPSNNGVNFKSCVVCYNNRKNSKIIS